MDLPPRPRRTWIALLLGLVCNGLGHAYAGRIRTALVIYAAWLVALAGFVAALRVDIRGALVAGSVLLVYWALQAFHAARAARTPPGRWSWYSRPFGLAGLYVASVIATYAAGLPFEEYVPQAFYQTSSSMNPTLQAGDLLFAQRPVALERGEVIVHRAPAGARSADPLVKRVVAIERDVVEVRDGWLVLNGAPVQRERVPGPCTTWTRSLDGSWSEYPCLEFIEKLGRVSYHTYCTAYHPCGDAPAITVPAGHVFVLGDYRDRSADSRVYGPVDMGSILGRAAHVYFSLGPSGVRWERIGRSVN